ncbi:MAG: hypothetical protein QM763_22265 [Agriterribacter sp.]
MKNADCLLLTNALNKNISDEFSIEFLFNGSSFFFLTFSEQMMVMRCGYSLMHFKTTTLQKDGGKQTNELNIQLDGSGRKSYNYYADDLWHHFVFTASLKTNKMEVWIDGECPEGFSAKISPGEKFGFGSNDGFRNTDKIDELAFYKNALSSSFIRSRYQELLNTGNANASSRVSSERATGNTITAAGTAEVDPKEFAPGYPDYTIQAIDQLRSFPLPRYNNAVKIKRNMSWMDISYLHRQLPSAGGKGFGKVDAGNAVAISEEMAKHWNYYIDIPVLRVAEDIAAKVYADTNTLQGALINYANKNPQYPVSTIMIQAQVKPVNAGFDSQVPYVSSQNLPDHYYFRDAGDSPIVYNRRKNLSPLMPLDIIEKDGKTSRFYLDQLLKYLHWPPALINENGEVFGHILPETLLKSDPRVWADYYKSGLTLSQYSGRFQFRMDSVYRNAIITGLDKNVHFSFYNLSAFNSGFWPDYSIRRTLNRWDEDIILPTPDFYPRWPYNWQNARGAFNGYGTVSKGRVTEIAQGDRLFSPFVSAGWDDEESNIRPAQWLALLKAMVMLGADFFYTGYFNVTSGGKWPNGVGPNDPRGYTYQIAIPSYAQAIKTWVPDFFENGVLLNPAGAADLTHQYRFKTKNENELVIVRKLGKKFLIYGSLQPNNNVKGNIPYSKKTTIILEGKPVSFEIRRQGSIYILDNTNTTPFFYQLDKWHQYEHPSYWSKQYVIEPELLIPLNKANIVAANDNADPAIAFITLKQGQSFQIPLQLRSDGRYNVKICLKIDSNAELRLKRGNTQKSIKLKKAGWTKVDFKEMEFNDLPGEHIILAVIKGSIQVDTIELIRLEK